MDVPAVKSRTRRLLPSRLGAVLEFTGGEDKGREIPLVFTRTVLGRKFGDILLRDIKVSSSHAAIEYRGGSFRLLDLDSSNGTYVENRRVRAAPLEPGREVRIGLTSFKLTIDVNKALRLTAERPMEAALAEGGLTELIDREFLRPEGPAADGETDGRRAADMVMEFVVLFGPAQGKRFTFDSKSVLLGRVHADLNLMDPDVSRKHALAEMQDSGQIVLRDLASRNGTYVNDVRITNRVLTKGDRIRVGQSTIVFSGLRTL